MPELPEVETRVRELREPCVGRTIEKAAITWPQHIADPSPRQLVRRVRGQRIQALNRRGKFLVFSLSTDVLLIHLRMSGDLSVAPVGMPPDKHAHTVFLLDNHHELRFSDTRKFGRVYLVDCLEKVVGHLGPEPLADDFTGQHLAKRLAGRKRALKPLLLDQTFLAGMGNIYTDEALHLAGLHPARGSDTLAVAEARKLWRSLRRVLRDGIRHNGSSIDWAYKGGDHQNHFRVYRRAGEPCLRCGSPIRKINIGQRGTHYCPQCQPEP